MQTPHESFHNMQDCWKKEIAEVLHELRLKEKVRSSELLAQLNNLSLSFPHSKISNCRSKKAFKNFEEVRSRARGFFWLSTAFFFGFSAFEFNWLFAFSFGFYHSVAGFSSSFASSLTESTEFQLFLIFPPGTALQGRRTQPNATAAEA
jgi:hypothetical protein